MITHPSPNKGRKGFTLVELAVVIVIIGVLAAFGVPKFLNSVERSKATEAVAYLSAIQSAQERFIAKEGVYSNDPTALDITVTAPKYFTASTTITTSNTVLGTATWTMTLTRIGSTSSFGSYSVTFTQDGFDPTNSSITTYPAINPLGTATSSSSS
jgi:type II secretion system protein G